MSEKVELSRQQRKSQETREKIFQAAKKILQKKGYEELSIKNICEEAGVSNGSFYHHFKTKDDLLSYYIEEQPTINPDLLEIPENAGGVEQGIIQVYMNYVKYCRELGVEFMSGYYDTKNQALNAAIRTERPYPIVTVQTYVEKAIEAGMVKLNVSIEEFTTDIRMIVIGNVFEWCLKSGDADFEGNMRRSLTTYLNGLSNRSLHIDILSNFKNLQRMNAVCTHLLPILMPDLAEGFFSGNRLRRSYRKRN